MILKLNFRKHMDINVGEQPYRECGKRILETNYNFD